MYGSGIVCGFGVYSLDDLSLFIESGFAIDSLGREIIIDSSVVKKLSAIEGFEQIDSNRLTLCIRYKEEQVHPVYSVNRQKSENEYEFNRTKEGYELFFVATDNVIKNSALETEFLTNDILYQDEDYCVKVELPATVCIDKYVKIKVKVTKLSSAKKIFSFNGCIQLPAFTTTDGTHELNVDFTDVDLQEGENVTQEYWVYVQKASLTETVLILKNGTCTVSLNNEQKEEESNLSLKILISDIEPRELVDRELGKVSLELYGLADMNDFICLADITLIRTDSAYIIEQITERNVKKYIETPAANILRNEYSEYFKASDIPKVIEQTNPQTAPKLSLRDFEKQGTKVATGIVEIPIGDHAKAGDVFYSGEIMHGLGIGNVYVEVGQEIMENNGILGANSKSTIYGNASLFNNNKKLTPDTDTAVKVLNDKGSFVVAAKFEKDFDCVMLTYRWVAIKLSVIGEENNGSGAEQWIEAETPTIALGTGESAYLGVKFHNMDKCSIDYEVVEKQSGEVTMDGIYTAPNKEGVYEIKISCVEKPFICTYVYVIVKKK
jgi:NAD-dependent dihydropyrimidine dehydrogenase PreA subunit